MFYNENVYYLLCSCTNSILGKFLFLRYEPKCSQPVRSHDFLINHISRTNHWNNLIFCMLIQIHINKSWSINCWVGMIKNRCSQYGHMTLKLIVSQEWIDRMNWFFASWCTFRRAKSYFNDFWVGIVKNGHGHLFH